MGDNHSGESFNGNRVLNDVGYPSFQSHGIKNKGNLARHLLEIEAYSDSIKILLYVVFITLLAIMVLMIVNCRVYYS